MDVVAVLFECLIYLGWFVILNPFAIVLDILGVSFAVSRGDLLEVTIRMIVRWSGMSFSSFAPIAGAFADTMAPIAYSNIINKGSQFINDKIIKPLKSLIWR